MPPLQTIDLSGQGIGTEEGFGFPILTQFPPMIRPIGLSSDEAFGLTDLAYSQIIRLTGIPSEETFGRNQVIPGASVIDLAGDGIPSAEAFGTGDRLMEAILLTGIPSEETFGLPYISTYTPNWSIKYLPPYNQAQDLYKVLICPVIDFVMLQDFVRFNPKNDQDLLNQAHELLASGDDEALLAYFKTMIKPIVGTYEVIKLIISFGGYSDQTVFYWYQYGGRDFYFKVIAGVIAGSTYPGVKADDPTRIQNLITTFDSAYDALTNLIIQYKNERSTLEALKLAITYYIGGPYYGVGIFPGEKIELYDKEISGQTWLDERGSVWLIPATFPCGS